jgi:hypothetical protein
MARRLSMKPRRKLGRPEMSPLNLSPGGRSPRPVARHFATRSHNSPQRPVQPWGKRTGSSTLPRTFLHLPALYLHRPKPWRISADRRSALITLTEDSDHAHTQHLP